MNNELYLAYTITLKVLLEANQNVIIYSMSFFRDEIKLQESLSSRATNLQYHNRVRKQLSMDSLSVEDLPTEAFYTSFYFKFKGKS